MRQVFTDDVVMDTTESGGGVDHRRRRVHGVPPRDPRRCDHRPPRPHARDRGDVGPRRPPGSGRCTTSLIWPNGIAAPRLRPLPRDLREGRRRVAHRVVEAHPPPHGLHRPRGELMAEVAVITGGASGFGLALADRCADHGMDVALLDLDADRAGAEAGSIAASHGVQAVGLGVDVSEAASVEAAAAAVEDRFGQADLVVSNVGVQLFGAVERFTDDEWTWVLDVNVVGSARVARAFIPMLRQHEGPAGVHDLVVGPRSGQPARRLPGQQVRGLGPGRDAPARARRRRHRCLGDLPVRDDVPAPRDERGGAARPRPPTDRRRVRLRRHGREQPRHDGGPRDAGGRRPRRAHRAAGRRAAT